MSNRLVHEDSPYLQQHKDNPFDWYPWCDDAFARAKHENKPLFISIGYSSCHWCHVMEHEVFENETIAEFVNRHFICIKVDKEERPDIDKHFQELHSLLNRRSGGWPLSIFCTPENKPFYAATYIPPYTRDRMMGFSELSTIITQKVAQRDEKLFQNADEILLFMQPDTRPTQATHLNSSIMVQFDKQADHNFDVIHGGFSKSPKFPHASTLDTLMILHALDPHVSRHTLITRTLNGMAKGGMYDLIEGGFCRYSTDEAWLVPHFEKMTYDNGLLCGVYAQGYAMFEEPAYRRCAEEIADFMTQKMMEDHLFYSASDADTQGEEGKYFIYTYDEVRDALKTAGVTDIQGALDLLELTPSGNFEGECIITLSSLERPAWFEAFAHTCRHLRSLRPYPFIDRKVNTAWNAMMINALFILGKHTHHYEIQAIASLNALLSTMWIDDTLYHTTLIHKTPKIGAFLEDYAYFSMALIQAYHTTLEETYLIQAQQLANKALEFFYDKGIWYFSRGSFATIAELEDGTYPSAMAVMVDVLLSLGSLVEGKYRHFAFKSLEYVSLKLMKTPIYYPKLTQQTIRYLKGDRIIKAPKSSLLQCGSFTYPFVVLKIDESVEGFLICGEHSCFASTPHCDALNEMIETTL